MKTRGMTILALAMAAALMAAPAMAQTINLQANVPFDFSAGTATLQSGRCSLQTLVGNVIRLAGPDNHAVAVTLALDDVRPAGDAKLVFHRYGDQYFLARVETQEASYKVPIAKREMKLAREAAPEQIALVAYAAAVGQ